MSVTDRDRERAMQLMAWDPLDYETFANAVNNGHHPDDLDALETVDAIAAALAEEREKARAPFLALAEEMEHHDAELCSAMAARKAREFDLASEAAYAMQAADLRMDARRIRRAAEVTK